MKFSTFGDYKQEMDIVTRKKLNILIQLAEADKHFAKVEREMIYSIAKERNFPATLIDELIKNPEPIDSLGALSVEQKLDYLFSIIDLVLVDQNVFESEVIFCKNIAIKLGFKKNVIDFLLDNYKKKTQSELREAAFNDFR